MESASKVFLELTQKEEHQIELAYAEEVSCCKEETLFPHVLQIFLSILFEGKRSLSVYFTKDPEMKELNFKFRNKNVTTDILSWSYWEEDPDAELVGDLVLSVDQVQKQAQENGWDFDTEVIRLLAHGCVHLAGWDHERSSEEANQMLILEKKLLAQVGYSELYPSS